VYEQPVIPGPGYIWTPGYWAWSPIGYYWVPGTWVRAPQVGVLWTPGYWGWGGHAFIWNPGYWGPQVGYYGGVNYGFGYTGSGYEGGYWNNGEFFYNRSVNNITNVTNITNVYYKTVINKVTVTRVSYHGGKGGVTAQPTAAQWAAARERHIPPTVEQTQHQRFASSNRALLASVNHGKPSIAATSKPGVFSGRGMVAAKAAAPYHPAAPAVANRTAPRGPNPGGGGDRLVNKSGQRQWQAAEASRAAQERAAASRAVRERAAASRATQQQSAARAAQERQAASRAAQQAAANRAAAASRLGQERAAASRVAQARAMQSRRPPAPYAVAPAPERRVQAAPHRRPL
jgi:hypothetical protein